MEETFESYRAYLFAIAYRMLGSAMDAEDMLQETYVRYAATPKESIRSLKAYLATILTRLCIDQLQLARRKREVYVGTWLPEPILTPEAYETSDPEMRLYQEESISLAFLVLLEQLQPFERAVFLLREVFNYEYDEVATMLGKSEAACRRSLSRAKQHLHEHRPRFPASPAAHANMVSRFMDACLVGNIDGLMRLLAEDVTVWSDGGGKVAGAARHPIQGRNKVARAIIGFLARAPEGTTVAVVEANGLPALLVRVKEQIVSLLTLEVEGNFICTVRTVANPDKLAHLNLPTKPNQEWRIRS